MTAPLHAFYLRADEHTVDSVLESLLDLHLDQVWLRLAAPAELRWDQSSLLQLELRHLRDGLPIVPEFLGPTLSTKGRTVLRLSADRSTVAYQLFRDGEVRAIWAGDVETFGQQDGAPPKEKRSAEELAACRAEFLGHFRSETRLELDALLNAETVSEEAADLATPGTLALVRGRVVRPVEGMGRWPELFRFHDRGQPDPDAEEADRVALIALDLKQAERLWKRTPAGQVYQFLRLLEPIRASVLGPLAHVLPEALAGIETVPPEAPLATSENADLTTFELLAMGTALCFMVGDNLRYLDERFYPLISLSEAPVPRAALSEALGDIRGLGVLSAMVEVLPYSVPEGEMMESIGDEELSPLASWAVQEGSYEGSLFLLEATRLRKLVEDFDIEKLHQRIDDFLRAWFELEHGAAESFETWRANRYDLDAAELARFEDTFVELQHVLALAELNQLAPALLFYSE